MTEEALYIPTDESKNNIAIILQAIAIVTLFVVFYSILIPLTLGIMYLFYAFEQ